MSALQLIRKAVALDIRLWANGGELVVDVGSE